MAWLSGWGHRVKLTTDNGDVDATLTDFPILLHLGAAVGRGTDDISFIFDEIAADANRKKIALQDDATGNECYVEIEEWTDAIEEAWLWSKAPTIHADSPDDFYFYFDADHADNDSYVGDPSDAVVHNVWDSNFKFVSHMRDDPDTSHIRDSTVNANDGTKKGAAEPAVTTAGKISDAQTFDEGDDYVGIGTLGSFGSEMDSNKPTFSCWVKSSVTDAAFAVMGTFADGATTALQLLLNSNNATEVNAGYIRIYLRDEDYLAMSAAVESNTGITDGAWHHLAVTLDGPNDTVQVFVDGVSKTIVYERQYTPANFADFQYQMYIGDQNIRGVTDRPFGGVLDEVCLSNTIRTSAWIKASYESERDNLLDWGSEELCVIFMALAGTLTSVGVTTKTTSKYSTDSYIPFSGALVGVHSIFRSVAGVMASAGALVKIPTKMFAGALTSSSTLTRNIYKNCAGTLTSASTLTRNIWKYVAGAVTPTGAIAHSKIFVKAIAGVLTSSATLGKTLVAYIQACAGTLTPTGALTKYTKLYNACAGTLTSAGAVTKQTFLNCAGVVWTLAGTVSRNIYKEVAGGITPTGALSKVALFFKECAGTITPTGAITKFIYKYVAAGIITPTGTITKWVRIKLLGTVTPAGTVSKFTQKTIGGTLSLIGRLVAWIHGPAIVCTLTFEEELDTTLTFEEELETTLYFEGG